MRFTRTAPLTGGGTINGDLTIEGDITVNGGGSYAYSEVITGDVQIVGANGTVSGTADADGDEFVIRNNNDAGMSILAGESSGYTSSIIFGSANDLNGANIFWEYHTKTLKIGTQDASGSGILTLRSGNGADALTINASQQIGINTNAPAYVCEIKSSGTSTSPLVVSNSSNTDIIINYEDGSGNAWYYMKDAGGTTRVRLSSAGTSYFTGGNVGIGTSSLSTVHTDYSALQVGGQGLIFSNTTAGTDKSVYIGNNVFKHTDTSWDTIVADEAMLYEQHGGKHYFYVAPATASAGDTANLSTKFVIDTNSRISLSNNDSGGTGGSDSTSGNTLMGAYAGLNIADGGVDNNFFGHAAGNKLTTGDYNVGVGNFTGFYNVTGSRNTHVGYGAGWGNSLNHSNSDNTGIGFSALKLCTTGVDNVAVGAYAGINTTTGSSNVLIGKSAGNAFNSSNVVAIGKSALASINNANGNGSVAVGHESQTAMTSGSSNTSLGYFTLHDITTEIGNVAIGYKAGEFIRNDASDFNVIIGQEAGVGGTAQRDYNVAIGYRAMGSAATQNNVGASNNVFIGSYSGNGTWTTAASSNNTAVGYGTMSAGAMNDAGNNSAFGADSLKDLTTGDNNTALGQLAATDLSSGSSNVAVGRASLYKVAHDESDNVAVGTSAMEGAMQNGTVGDTNREVKQNVAIGSGALYGGTLTGANHLEGNIAIGHQSLDATGAYNQIGTIAIGTSALGVLEDGTRNTAIGYQALDAVVGGDDNTAVGYQALSAQDGDKTGATAIGSKALYQNAPAGTSDYSVAVGYEAGSNQTTGYQNTFLGGASSGSGTDGINQIVIGYHAASLGDNTAVIGNEDITDVYLADDVGATLHSFKGSIGDNKTPTAMLEVWKDNINSDHYTSSDDFIGIRGYFKYTGASSKDFGNDDDLYGTLLQTEFDDGQSSGAFRNMYGISVDANAVDCADSGNTLGAYIRGKLGGADADIEKLFGAHIVANLSHDGTVDNDVRGALVEIDADDGTVGGNMAGLEVNVDLEANCEVAGDVVGVLIGVDDDDASAGSAYGMRINCASNVTAAIDLVGGGIRFPSSQSASSNSNTLDDYEEGEYQPTVNASTSGSFTPGNSRTYLTYTKIGRQVTVSGQIDISNESSPSGNLQVSLPFTVGATTEAGDTAFGVGQISSHGGTIANNCSSVAFQGEALMKFFNVSDSGTFAYITESDIDHSFSIHISITFIAA